MSAFSNVPEPDPSSPASLAGKHIAIIGATSGMGQACTLKLYRLGAQLTLTSRSQDKLDQLCAALPDPSYETRLLDVAQPETLTASLADLPTLDGLLYLPGECPITPIRFLKPDKLQQTLQVNCLSAIELTRLLLSKRRLSHGASLVYLSSISAVKATQGHAAYSASKAALEAFVRTLALELSPQKIRANCLQPGMVATPMLDAVTQHLGEATMQPYLDTYPLGVGQPDDIAHAVAYLMSDASKWQTGTTMRLDGGATLS